MKIASVILSAALLLAAGMPAMADQATGAGSTFVYPVLAKWADTYKWQTSDEVNYQSIGSGGGIAQVKSRTVDFGASDMPMKPAELERLGLAQFPLVVGGVVPVVNLAGVKPGEIRFTGPLLADIFLGNVTKWNDPRLRTLNPELHLPAADIIVVHRSDGSGTTFNWANYLSKVSPEWRERVGEGTAVEWPLGIGSKGNEGVAVSVKNTPFSIGYVEYAYVMQNHMTDALVQNKAGTFVRPEMLTFQAAASSADWAGSTDFYLIMTDAPGGNAYPIAATVFVLMPKQPRDPGRAKVAMKFFKWALEQGQLQALSLDYVPLPNLLVRQIENYWRANLPAFE